MAKFGTLNRTGEVVPYDYGKVCFRQPMSGERRHAALNFRLQIGNDKWLSQSAIPNGE
jgi:hypothetical protein